MQDAYYQPVNHHVQSPHPGTYAAPGMSHTPPTGMQHMPQQPGYPPSPNPPHYNHQVQADPNNPPHYNQQIQTDPPEVYGPADGWFDYSSGGYLKGFLVGAGLTLLLTNSTVQRTMIRATVKLWSLVQGGVEEVKEQFQDIKAEMSQEK